jgi:hypothetical protein
MADIVTDANRALANVAQMIALAIALFLGLVSFATVLSIHVDCRDVYVTSDDGRLLTADNGRPLTTGQRSCHLVIRATCLRD